MLTSFASSNLKAKHITLSQVLKLTMFIVFYFYNNLNVYSYLHMNSYIMNLQMTNFITTLSWKMDETFELPTKHDILQTHST